MFHVEQFKLVVLFEGYYFQLFKKTKDQIKKIKNHKKSYKIWQKNNYL